MSVSASVISEDQKTRIAEIRSAIQTILDAHEHWEQSEVSYFSEGFETAIGAGLNVILNGDVPRSMIGLFSKVTILAEIWTRIIQGDEGIVDAEGMPKRQFWDALRVVRESFEQSEVSERRGIEPVRDLLKQMRNFDGKYDQIARMYGRYDADRDKYTGPFFHSNGTPNVALIEQEGKRPGSVVPIGYNPLTEQQDKNKAAGLSALAKVRQRLAELSGKPIDKDPATVEQMLREGQFADVIARVKGVSEKFVRSEAARLGIVLRSADEVLNEAFEKMQREDRENGSDGAYLDAMGSAPSASEFGYQDNQGDIQEDLGDSLGDDDSGESGDLIDDDSDADNFDSDDSGDSGTDSDSDSDIAEELELKGADLRAFVELAASENPDVSTSEVVKMIRDDGQTASPITVGRLLAAAKRG